MVFNLCHGCSKGGKFVLRIEDTDLERSTKESEEAVLRDLSWLGLDRDEGYCLEEMKLYVSDNRVILTKGVDGIVPFKYFERIESWPDKRPIAIHK
ncbi:unnamed protein product [Dovyalis caffra]|uniref:Glutamyl/glutaminyl-tRNA synthetase class Ib catalytic domain-containing protein n=1 Tax=Dovyalis caffra TaxID=77055 RepID=A0AAV1RQQ6_9ROSI|nr:unnamed protein product [Dovyalis caffra]